MGHWYNKKIMTSYFKIQKGEWLSWLLAIIDISIMQAAIFLFLYFTRLEEQLADTTLATSKEVASLIQFSGHGLNIVLIACVIVSIFTLFYLQYFKNNKNLKRRGILRVLGMSAQWHIYMMLLESLIVSVISTVFGGVAASIIFKAATVRLFGLTEIPGIYDFRMASKTAGIFIGVFCLFFMLQYLSGQHMRRLSVNEYLRRSERKANMDDKRRGGYVIILIILIYSCLINIISEKIQTAITGTIILSIIGLSIYLFAQLVLLLINRLTSLFMPQGSKRLIRLVLELRGMEAGERIGLIMALSLGLILLFFIISVEWGMENYLERYWRQTQQINSYIVGDTTDESLMVQWLTENKITYVKLYMKVMEAERIALAVTDEKNGSPFYAERGFIKTVQYNLNRWGQDIGELHQLDGEMLVLGQPMDEKAFQLVNYTVMVNYEDWKEHLDESYAVVFGINANERTLPVLTTFANKYHFELMTPRQYVLTIKAVYGQYLSMLKIMMVILIISTHTFIFSVILASAVARRKEFFLYRGCGGSWRSIKWLFTAEYLFIGLLGAGVAGISFLSLFNGIKLLFLRNSVVYFMGIGQIFSVVVLVLGVVLLECGLVLSLLQLKNNQLYFRE